MQEHYLAGDTDFTTQLAAVAKSAPDTIFLPGFVPEVALIVKQGKKMGIDAIFIGADGWSTASLIEEGGNALEGAYFLDHFSANGSVDSLPEETLQFIAGHIAAYGDERPTSRLAPLAYDAVYIVVRAILCELLPPLCNLRPHPR